jgi:hypothetical protein
MNWITTNIRLPEDLYMDLKMDAAKNRKSVAAVVRDRLGAKKEKQNGKDLWKRVSLFAKELSQKNRGVSLSEKLIEMRYEQ